MCCDQKAAGYRKSPSMIGTLWISLSGNHSTNVPASWPYHTCQNPHKQQGCPVPCVADAVTTLPKSLRQIPFPWKPSNFQMAASAMFYLKALSGIMWGIKTPAPSPLRRDYSVARVISPFPSGCSLRCSGSNLLDHTPSVTFLRFMPSFFIPILVFLGVTS